MTDTTKIECYKCKKLLADNLVLPKGLCVYCAADEADQLPEPKKQQKTVDKSKIRAEQELVMRILSRKRMIPFVEKFNPDYQAGWVHKDVCKRLEKFSQDVADQKIPQIDAFHAP